MAKKSAAKPAPKTAKIRPKPAAKPTSKAKPKAKPKQKATQALEKKRVTPESPLDALPIKQKAFVLALLTQLPGRNLTQAAIQAGYSKKTASVTGCQLLMKPNIQAVYDALAKSVWEKMQMDADEALARTAEMARADMSDMIENVEQVKIQTGEDKEGNALYRIDTVVTLKPFTELNGRLIKEISVGTNGQPKLVLHDSQAALDKILRVHGKYKDTSADTGWGSLLAHVQKLSKADGIQDAEFEEIKE